MSENWEANVKKNRNIPLIIILSIVVVILIVFVFNNFDIFTTEEDPGQHIDKKEQKIRKETEKVKPEKEKEEKKEKKKRPEPAEQKPITSSPSPQQSKSSANLPVSEKRGTKEESSSPKKAPSLPDSSNIVPSDTDAASILMETGKTLLSVELPGVTCAIADRKDVAVKMSLRCKLKGEELRKEILLKRENLNIMVKRVLKRKKHKEIFADALRIELIKEMNLLLEQGQIEDIEFLKFQPVKK